MITVEEASKIIKSYQVDLGVESIPLNKSIGRILREPIVADRDFPPYDRVTMDGIAIRFDDWENGRKTFEIAGVAAAGAEKMTLSQPGKCLEVMTGAIMPDGVDTVIPYEKISIADGQATLTVDAIKFRQNIHFKGSDRKAGEKIIHPGKKISSVEVGICSTVGKSVIQVSKLPRTMVISSGDELVGIDETPLPHQIRASNVYRLETVLSDYKIPVDTAHIPDDYEKIVEALKTYVEKYEVLILSGGVSMGKFDYLPKALQEIGVKQHFHKIKQRPGKPFWFGTAENTTVFAFPGNPVSSFMCMNQYFIPWLNGSLLSEETLQLNAVLTQDVKFEPELTYFLEVKLGSSPEGKLLAQPVKGNGSGDLANLTDADAFIILPQGKNEFRAGEAYPILIYRPIF